MDNWITFWKYVYIVGLASFFVVGAVIVPLGARDLMALFRRLGGEGEGDDTKGREVDG